MDLGSFLGCFVGDTPWIALVGAGLGRLSGKRTSDRDRSRAITLGESFPAVESGAGRSPRVGVVSSFGKKQSETSIHCSMVSAFEAVVDDGLGAGLDASHVVSHGVEA